MAGFIPAALVIKIHYKTMYSVFASIRSFNTTQKCESLFLQTDLSKANTVISKCIKWNDISLLDEWILE